MSQKILTTHAGSLPRTPELTQQMYRLQEGAAPDGALDNAIRHEVADVVGKQIQTGIDIVSDGEVGKVGFLNYVRTRIEGFGGTAEPWSFKDLIEVPDLMQEQYQSEAGRHINMPRCIGPLKYVGEAEVRRDIGNFRAALAKHGGHQAFIPAPSPGVIAMHATNDHYGRYEDYLDALTEVLRVEYELIADAGFALQLDAPDMPTGWPAHGMFYASKDVLGRLGMQGYLELHIEAMNRATAKVPADRLRLHLCWGNYQGPHHYDAPLREIIEPVLKKSRARIISFEAANPRHDHEWQIFKEIKLPDDTILMPGVIDTLTHFVEHPELVAQRLERFARLVGVDRVMAGTDCGFGTFVGFGAIRPHVVWLKLAAMVEGAKLASDRLS